MQLQFFPEISIDKERITSMIEDETTLIQQCQSGHKESFDLLYHKYHKMVFHIAQEMMGREQDTEDIVQEVFMRVLTRINQFRYEASFSSWLSSIAVNVCKDKLRSKKRYPEDPLDKIREHEIYTKRASLNQEEELIMNELLEDVQEKISHLKKEHQKLIVLRYMDGLSYEKMAQLLGYSPSLVKSRLHQARKELQRICQNLATKP